MSERYEKLFSLPENLYTEGSPVIIAAGALLKDNQTGKVLAQLKIQNIVPKKIKAATVCIQPLDTVSNPLGDTVTYQYLDLSAGRDSEFGQKTPIILPDSSTRSFAVSIKEVIFADNAIWCNQGQSFENLQVPKAIRSLNDGELAKQFQIEYGADCQNELSEPKDLWYCVCGAVNHKEESSCHQCGRILSDIKSIDLDDVLHNMEERIAKEQAEATVAHEAAQKAAEKRNANIKRYSILAAMICLIIIAFAVVTKQAVIPAIRYNNAVTLKNDGNYLEAIATFEILDEYKDSIDQIVECKYHYAFEMLDAGRKSEAAILLSSIDYKDSSVLCKGLWDELAERESVSLESRNTIGLKLEGTVVAVGDNEDSQCNVSDWTDIVAISAASDHTIGLKSDGTVVAAGDNDHEQCNVSGWTDIVAVYAEDFQTFGLKSDGTVVAVGYSPHGECDVSDWTDVVAVYAEDFQTFGLKSDGTVVAVGLNKKGECDVAGWTDIVAISAGFSHTVGLKSDGTVVATGSNGSGQCNVSDWTDIVAISAASDHTIGLKSDGTVVAVGDNDDGECNVSDWTDIVAISASWKHTVGLKSDGTVVAAGDNDHEQCNVSGWTDIVAIFVESYHTVGLKSGGTVVATGNNKYGQCNVSDWADIKVP